MIVGASQPHRVRCATRSPHRRGPERAEIVKWLYRAYASGEWTLAQLRDELADRGVRAAPRPNRPARPLAISHLKSILRNRYYVGVVTFEGVEYPGKHPALVAEDLWHRVQAVCQARYQSGEKPRQNAHYLKGSLYCGQCGHVLGIEVVRNRQGFLYPYFYWLGAAEATDQLLSEGHHDRCRRAAG